MDRIFFLRPRIIQSLRHIKNGPLFSGVMLCRAEVSLGKCGAKGFVPQSSLLWQHLYWSKSCEPGGQSQKVLESACLFPARNPV